MLKKKLSSGFILLSTLLLLTLAGCCQKTHTYDVLSITQQIEEVTDFYSQTPYPDIIYTCTYMDDDNIFHVEKFSLSRNQIGLGESNQVVIVDELQNSTSYLYLTEELLQPDTIIEKITGEE